MGMMSEHARELQKYLEEVEGGREVLEARNRELYPEVSSGRPGDGEVYYLLGAAVAIRRGSGGLPESFWSLPFPEDPEASVRRALEEDGH